MKMDILAADITKLANLLPQQKLDRFEESWIEVRRVSYELGNLESKVNDSIRIKDLIKLEKEINESLNKYATKEYVNYFEETIGEYVSKKEYEEMKEDNRVIVENIKTLISKDETEKLVHKVRDDISKKFEQYPTLKIVDQAIEPLFGKINELDAQVLTAGEQVETQSKELNITLKDFSAKIDSYGTLLDEKIDLPYLDPLWKNFERFALYDDFKDLYGKVMPEIKKFESRIIIIDKEIDKNNQIIQEFDKSISQKANKVSTRDFEKYVDEHF